METIEGQILRVKLDNLIEQNNIDKQSFLGEKFHKFQKKLEKLTFILTKYLRTVLNEFEHDIPCIKANIT